MRTKINSILFLLLCMSVISCKKSQESSPSTPPPPTPPVTIDPAKNKIVFIWKTDTTEAGPFQRLMQANKCNVTLLNRKDLASFDFSTYKLIAIGSEADGPQTIPSWTTADSTAIVTPNKPLLLIGVGGSQFSGKLNNTISYRNNFAVSSGNVIIVDKNSVSFSSPKSISLPANNALQLYASVSNTSAYFSASLPIQNVLAVGKITVGNYNYYPIAVEKYRYWFWGYTSNADALTDTGRDFFVNYVYATGSLDN